MPNALGDDEDKVDLPGDAPSKASTHKAGRRGDDEAVRLPGDDDPRSSGGSAG